MNYYAHYDETTGAIKGFYCRAVHGDSIPSPCIEITREQWEAALDSPHIVSGGELVPAPPVSPSAAQKVAALTAEYEPRFDELRRARVSVQAAGYGNEAVAEIDAEYQALMSEFNAKMEAIS